MSNAASLPGGGRVRTVRLPADPASVPRARRILVEDLQAREVGQQVVDEAEIVISELVANAVRHGRPLSDGTVRMHWAVKDGLVEVEVSDGGGTTTPQPLPRSTWTPTGRGLRIVRSIAHEWGVVQDKPGCTVWAALGGPSRRRA